ncbi:hypothetical protein [Francisella marina]|uniref:hypothetical protein n=1 Tax=Francisella marina TaxID=2249302 RepID=UPI0011ECEEED|nr:hypothetical protein [Francisella marina]QEO58329.1 hypothetical protein F0R75_00530 [Francisella marina]
MFIQGTATSYINLLGIIIDNAKLNGWNAVSINGVANGSSASLNTSPADNDSDQNICYLQSTGYSGSTNVQVELMTNQNSSAGRYNYKFRTGIYDIAGVTSYKTNLSTVYTESTLWDGTINYWLSISIGRIMCTWRIGSSYYHFYAGYFYPYVLPSQYIAPLISIGNQIGTATSKYTDDTKTYSGGYCSAVSNLNSAVNQSTLRIYPFRKISNGAVYDGDFLLGNVLGTTNEFLLRDCHVIYNSFLAGKLDGVYQVSSTNNTAENIITDAGGMQYICFPQHQDLSNGKMYAVSMENI